MSAWRPVRAAACDELIRRLSTLERADPPLRLLTHPLTSNLTQTPSPLADAAYKHREDLIDALLCAWTAALWQRHGLTRSKVLAADTPADSAQVATIIAPARPEQRPPAATAESVRVRGPAGAAQRPR